MCQGVAQIDVKLMVDKIGDKVQVIPSELYIVRDAPETMAMATKRLCGGLQQTDHHEISEGVSLQVHVMPSGEVITR